MLKRRIGLLLLCVEIALFCSAAFGENGQEIWKVVTVKNYAELLDAVNNHKAEYVFFSRNYRHAQSKPENIVVEAGRTVTFSPDSGERTVITGRFDITGEGTVVFNNIDIAAPNDEIGLWVGYGAHVEAGSVTAGKAKNDYGKHAVYVFNGHLKIESAQGSDGKKGSGGDGVFACNNATVEIGTAIGGNAPDGLGGSGVAACGGAVITVTGSAKGGDGLYGAGKGVLLGWGSSMTDGGGILTDGKLLEGNKKLDPTVISNKMLLENALRNGETDIQIDAKFKAGSDNNMDLLSPAETIKLRGNPDGKHLVIDCGLNIYGGNWILDGLDIQGKATDYTAVYVNKGNLNLNGSVSGKTDMGLVFCEGGRTHISGSVDQNRNSYAICVKNADLTVDGNVTQKANTVAVQVGENGNAIIHGDITNKGQKGAAIVIVKGTISVEGTISGNGKESFVLYNEGGKAYISGAVIVNNVSGIAVETIDKGITEITGSVSGKTDLTIVACEGSTTRIAGPVIQNGKGLAIYNLTGTVDVEGDVSGKTEKPLVWCKGRELHITGSVIQDGNGRAIYATIGDIVVDGNVFCAAKNNHAIVIESQFSDVVPVNMTIHGNVTSQTTAALVKRGGHLVVDGEMTVNGKGKEIYITEETGTVTINGMAAE